tara:strand:- start:86 stop:193 length:108 start_codon:yes stop_codon:yes gene_type:complete
MSKNKKNKKSGVKLLFITLVLNVEIKIITKNEKQA